MIQQPRVPSSGLMPASDVAIRAKEVSLVMFYVEIVSNTGLKMIICMGSTLGMIYSEPEVLLSS